MRVYYNISMEENQVKNPTNEQSIQGQVNIDYDKIVETVIKHHEKAKGQELIDHKRNQIKNTRMLLKKYRSLVIYSKDAVYTMKKARDILNDMFNEILLLENETTEANVEAIYRSKERTLIMVAHIKNVMDIYKTMCEKSYDPHAIERYNEVYAIYLDMSNNPKNVAQLSRELHKDKSTIYADITRVCEDLAPLLFGVNTL